MSAFTALRAALSALILVVALAVPAGAVTPAEVLDDPALESRARSISANLRCMVCQNQSIDDSDAELARDLRLLVRDRLVAGDSDGEVVDYVVSRYGEFVLLTPRLSSSTILLWAAPALMLGFGIAALTVFVRRRPALATPADPLTREEQAMLAKVLRDRDEGA
jgi:cytochrome c-type biogenesis protein CcmH